MNQQRDAEIERLNVECQIYYREVALRDERIMELERVNELICKSDPNQQQVQELALEVKRLIGESVQYQQRAEAAEARVKELEARIAVLGDSGLTAAWHEIDALRARLEAIKKQPTSVWLLPNGCLTESEKLAVTFDGAIELIERPNLDRNANSPTATAEGRRAGEGKVGPPR